LQDIENARASLGERVLTTPVQEWESPARAELVGPRTRVFLKLELLQRTGSFKARGALLNMLSLSPDQLARGVTAISAGNHAVAVAYAAQALKTSAHLVIIRTANPFRVELCRRYGAEVELADSAHAGFERVGQVVPIGGGGLCAGVASVVKVLQPRCRVYGVEPTGADSMHRSFAAGEPRAIERVATIADSLGAPYAMPISFELCRRNVDALALVTDEQLRDAMRLMQRDCKLAVEPAGAAAMAALLGPLRAELMDRRVALIVSGSNIDSATYARWLEVS
jgi:threonine dehydratase